MDGHVDAQTFVGIHMFTVEVDGAMITTTDRSRSSLIRRFRFL